MSKILISAILCISGIIQHLRFFVKICSWRFSEVFSANEMSVLHLCEILSLNDISLCLVSSDLIVTKK